MPRFARYITVILVAAVAVAACSTSPPSYGTGIPVYECDGPEQVPEGPVLTNVSYGPDDRHRADLYPTCSSTAIGTIMVVHGGGYTGGSKGQARDLVYQRLREQGWAIVSITYRLAPIYGWPAQPNDVQRAIDWWRAGAADAFGVPASPMVGMGWSAGGQLVEWNNVQDITVGFDASISMGGSTYWPDRADSDAAVALFGFSPSLGELLSASSNTHVDASDPPLLHVHGALDGIVDVSQAERLADTIATSGDPSIHTVEIVPACGHSTDCASPATIDAFLAGIAAP